MRTNTISRQGTSPLVIDWQVNLADGDYLFGTASAGEMVAELAGVRAVFSAANPVPQPGKYTLVIPGVQDDSASPAGSGYGKIVLNEDGEVHLKAKLADNVAASQNVSIGKNGEWPVCISLYSAKGLLIGWLRFGDDGVNDIFGTLHWMKPNQPGSKFYKSGFSIQSSAMGSRFVVPTGDNSVLQISDGLVLLNGGNLPDSVNPVTFGPKSKLGNEGPNVLKLTFTSDTGVFSGKFQEAGSSRVFVLLPKNPTSG